MVHEEICIFKDLSIYFVFTYVCFQLVTFVREHMWHKAMWMGYSITLELTLVWMVLRFVWVYIGITPLFSFLRECLLLFVLHLCFRVFVILLWVGARAWVSVWVCVFKVVSDSIYSNFFFCVCILYIMMWRQHSFASLSLYFYLLIRSYRPSLLERSLDGI